MSSFTGHTGRSTLRIVEDRDMAAFWIVGAFPLLVGVILCREKEPLLPAKIEMKSDFSLAESSKLLGRFMAVMTNAKSRGRLIDESKLRVGG